jgi:transcriptional regulator with XRE-family HTH domain
MSFQEKLQTLRKEKGLSQENLAESIGISRQAVAKWEAGQSYPDIDNLISLSNFLRVSIDNLVKDDEDCSLSSDRTIENTHNEDIIDFLCRAKKATYAGKGAEAPASRPNSHDLNYAEGNLKYIDSYLGGEKFAGEEAIWKDDVPCWSMNYIGRIVAEGFSGDFLKDALLLVPMEYPYRGPMMYHSGEYTYHCIVKGDFKWFHGYEEIFYNSDKVYECMFHGGSVK